MPRTRDVETVAAVRRAARDVLADVGPDRLTIRQVAAEADVSPQTLYNRFGSREAVLDDVAVSGYRQLCSTLLGNGSASLVLMDDPLERLALLADRFRIAALEDPNLCRFLFDEAMPWRSDRTRRAEVETLNLVATAVRLAVEAGQLLPGEPTELALRLIAAARGAAQLEAAQRAQPDRGQHAIDGPAVVATMIRGLRPGRSLSCDTRR